MGVPERLFTLWPKLRPAVRVIEKHGGGPDGIVFVTKDAQGLDACHILSDAAGSPVVEYDEKRILQSDFKQRVYDVVLRKNKQGGLFEKPIERLTVIIPRFDRRGEWIHLRLKFLFEHSEIPFLLLATVEDLKKLPSYLGGHYFECRKKGAAKGSGKKSRARERTGRG